MRTTPTGGTPAPTSPAPTLAYRDVVEFARAVGIGRSAAYEEVRAGRLRVAKVGRRTIVPVAEAQRWLAARMGA